MIYLASHGVQNIGTIFEKCLNFDIPSFQKNAYRERNMFVSYKTCALGNYGTLTTIRDIVVHMLSIYGNILENSASCCDTTA